MSGPILGHWKYTGEAFDVNDYFGFIYLITNNVSGKKYLGRKFFWVWKGRKKVRESLWKAYSGSCKPLTEDMKTLGKENFTFEIFNLYKTRGGLTYFENFYLYKFNVLTERDGCRERTWYNNHIGAVKFVPTLEVSEATRYKLSKAGMGRVQSEETRKKTSEALKGTRVGLTNPRADQTIYNWKHTNGVGESCTRVDLYTRYNLQGTSLTRLVNGTQKTHKGWSLIKD